LPDRSKAERRRRRCFAIPAVLKEIVRYGGPEKKNLAIAAQHAQVASSFDRLRA
jgi:hypothetical protein